MTQLARNSLYNLGATVVPAVISIVTVPFFIEQIGAARYGALAIAWLFLGYFGAADFGIGRAIMQRISAMRGEGRGAMADAVWSALASMVGFGILTGLVLWGLASWYFAGPFAVEPGLRSEILASVWALALCNPVFSLSGVLAGALMGLERFRLVSLSTGFANSCLLLFPLAISYLYSTDMTALVLAALAARLLGAAALAISVWRTFLAGHPFAFSRQEFVRLANFGAWIMLSSLIGPMMLYADRFLIGAVQNAVAVAAYAIPYQICSRTMMLPSAIAQALFPRFAAEDGAAAEARCRQLTVFVGQVFALLTVPLITLAQPLMSLWLGSQLDPRSVVVGQVLMAGFWAHAIAYVPFAMIQARGDPRFTALLFVAELVPYAALLAAFGAWWGLAGVATAFALRCVADCILLLRRANAADGATLLRLAITAAPVLGAIAAGSLLARWDHLLLAAAAVTGLAFANALALMPEEIRARLIRRPRTGSQA